MFKQVLLFLIAGMTLSFAASAYTPRATSASADGTIPTATLTATATPNEDDTPTPDPAQRTPTPWPTQPTATPLATDATMGRCDGNPWQFTSSTTTAHVGHSVAVVANYMFVFSGFKNVERTIINPDGTLANWQNVGEVPSGRTGAKAVTKGNFIYILGGQNIQFIYRNVDRVRVNEDGNLGSWEEMEPMIVKRTNFAAVVANGYIYAIGGQTKQNVGAGPLILVNLDSVERAKINEDGSLSPWQLVSTLGMKRSLHTAVVTEAHIYVMAGYSAGYIKEIERATLNVDGTLGEWQIVGMVKNGYSAPMSATDQGYIYLLGSYTNTVERVKYSSTGELENWQSVSPLNRVRAVGAAIAQNGNLYVSGRGPNLTLATSVEWVDMSTLILPYADSISINNGARYTNQTTVTLDVKAQPGATSMQLSNDKELYDERWRLCLRAKTWELTPFDNPNTPHVVYARFRHEDGNISAIVQDDIILDVTAPAGSVEILPSTALLRNGTSTDQHAQASKQTTNTTIYLPLVFAAQTDCPATGTPNIALQLSAQDDISGVAEMMLSNEVDFACAVWQPFGNLADWYALPRAKTTVFAKFRDYAGNVSETVQDTVILPSP